jgi:hypothetical protein
MHSSLTNGDPGFLGPKVRLRTAREDLGLYHVVDPWFETEK